MFGIYLGLIQDKDSECSLYQEIKPRFKRSLQSASFLQIYLLNNIERSSDTFNTGFQSFEYIACY